MTNFCLRWLGLSLLLVLSLRGGADSANDTGSAAEPIQPLPVARAPASTAALAKLHLGQQLFADKRLSHNNQVACTSCHDLKQGGVDHLRVSVGINGALGEINAPTVFNSGFNFRQFWNGRANSLEDQIDGPTHNPKEMGSSWQEIVDKLSADSVFNRSFVQVYPDGVTAGNIKDAIASFERALVTSNSRFDQYLRGNKSAITGEEHQGYEKFKSYGCVACHQGMNIGGNMFQTMGVMGNYFGDRKTPLTEADQGRFAVTKDEKDRGVFRVPSLRNVELTAPYFHDGSAKTLEQAVNIMAKYQLGQNLPAKDIEQIVKFLKTLTGERPALLQEVGG